MEIDPLEKDWQLKQQICNALKNPINIELDKKQMRLQFNNYTMRLKRLFKDNLEGWKKMKMVWKSIIDKYKEKELIQKSFP